MASRASLSVFWGCCVPFGVCLEGWTSPLCADLERITWLRRVRLEHCCRVLLHARGLGTQLCSKRCWISFVNKEQLQISRKGFRICVIVNAPFGTSLHSCPVSLESGAGPLVPINSGTDIVHLPDAEVGHGNQLEAGGNGSNIWGARWKNTPWMGRGLGAPLSFRPTPDWLRHPSGAMLGSHLQKTCVVLHVVSEPLTPQSRHHTVHAGHTTNLGHPHHTTHEVATQSVHYHTTRKIKKEKMISTANMQPCWSTDFALVVATPYDVCLGITDSTGRNPVRGCDCHEDWSSVCQHAEGIDRGGAPSRQNCALVVRSGEGVSALW